MINTRFSPITAILVSVALVLASAALAAPKDDRVREVEQTVRHFTESPFAIHGYRPSLEKQDDLQIFLDTGAHATRTGLTRYSTEPEEGTFDWIRPDKSISANEEIGTTTLPWLVSSSPWAQTERLRDLNKQAADRGSPSGSYQNLELPPDLDSYRRWVTTVVERYDGDGVDDMPGLKEGIHAWQIENEWTWRWSGTPEELLELHRVASEAVRAADPAAKIVLGGLTGIEGAALADGYLDDGSIIVGGKPVTAEIVREHPAAKEIFARINIIFDRGADYFDVVSLHKYGSYDHIPACVAWLEDKMAANGYSRPIIGTEIGGPFIASQEAYTPQAHCDALVKYHAVSLACGIQQIYWSALFGGGTWGPSYTNTNFVYPKGNIRPAYYTYQLLVKKLAGIKSAVRIPVENWDPETRIYKFERESGPIYIAWSERINGRHLTVPIEGKTVRQTDVRANETSLPVHKGRLVLDLTASPVFIEPVD